MKKKSQWNLKNELEKRRSPQGLRDYVKALKASVRSDPDERHRGHLKKGLYKVFLEELVPLSCFALLAYPESHQVQPVLGKQAYDAVVFDAAGTVVDKVELTAPHDGKTEADDARLVVDRGFGEVRTGDPEGVLPRLFPRLLATCHKKAAKDYSDCTLVIVLNPYPLFTCYEEQYRRSLEALVVQISKIKFRARRVFLLVFLDAMYGPEGPSCWLFPVQTCPEKE